MAVVAADFTCTQFVRHDEGGASVTLQAVWDGKIYQLEVPPGSSALGVEQGKTYRLTVEERPVKP